MNRTIPTLILAALALSGCQGQQGAITFTYDPKADAQRAAATKPTDAQLTALWAAAKAFRDALPAEPRPKVYYDSVHAFAPYGSDEKAGRGNREFPSIAGTVAAEFMYLNHYFAANDWNVVEAAKYGRSLAGSNRPVILDYNEPHDPKWYFSHDVWRYDKPACQKAITRHINLIKALRKDNPGLQIGCVGAIPANHRHLYPDEPQSAHVQLDEYRKAVAPLLKELNFAMWPTYTDAGEAGPDGFDKWLKRCNDPADMADLRALGLKNFIWLLPHVGGDRSKGRLHPQLLSPFQSPQPGTRAALKPNPHLARQLEWAWGEVAAGRAVGVGVWAGGVDTDLSGAGAVRGFLGTE